MSPLYCIRNDARTTNVIHYSHHISNGDGGEMTGKGSMKVDHIVLLRHARHPDAQDTPAE